MTKTSTKKLTNRQFTFMMFNYIVGFGFISTIGSIIQLGAWGIFCFFTIAFIAFGVMLVFSRLASNFPTTEGSSYGFSKLTHGRTLTFIQGWNQYIQGPVFAVLVPIFLEGILKNDFPAYSILWKILSIGIYALFIFISLLPISRTVRFIQYIAAAKWVILLLAFILAIVLTVRDHNYHSNWLGSDPITISAVTGAMLSFIYAFGGIEGITTIIKDTNGKSLKKNFFYTFIAIVCFYFVVFIVLFGIDMGKHGIEHGNKDLIRSIYNASFGVTGVVLFIFGIIANKSSAIIGSSIINAKSLAPMAIDGYFPAWIGKKKHDVYQNATYLSAGISLFMMFVFQMFYYFVPGWGEDGKSPFLGVLDIGTIAFFVQYFLTALTLLKLFWWNKRIKVPIWEIIIIMIMMLAIIFILLTQMIPPVLNEKFTSKTIVMDVSYISFIIIGVLFWQIPNIPKAMKWLSQVFKKIGRIFNKQRNKI